MVALRSPKELLAEIWAEFRKARYENDQEIIEYLAYLLTRNLPPPDNHLRSEKPSARYGVNEEAVQRLLDEAEQRLADKGGLAAFFDRYILFYRTAVWRTTTYPVPRHIVEFMLASLRIQSTHRFGDFTCGQGGFLVNKGGPNAPYPGESIGVEISGEAVRLAQANAGLHKAVGLSVQIHQGDAFAVCNQPAWNASFDCIAMAPPFGGKVEIDLPQDFFAGISDRSNGLLFTRLALRMLKPDGQAALLVPAGLLYNAGASRELRKELLEKHRIKAVLTLQPGIFLPYVTAAMHVFLFQKDQAADAGRAVQLPPTWFLHIANDGYPLSASRDLTADRRQDLPDDLPLARAVILPNAGDQEEFQFVPDITTDKKRLGQTLLYKPLSNTPGIVLKVHTNATLFSIRYFQTSGEEVYLLAHTSLREKSIYTVIPFSYGQVDVETMRAYNNINIWKRQTFRLSLSTKSEDMPAGRYIFGQGGAGQMIAIAQDGRLLGFTKFREEMVAAGYALSDRYWNQHAEQVQEALSAAQMLQRIRENQRLINDYADSLQGQLEVKHLLTQPLPPKLLAVGQFPLSTYLGAEQQSIWDEICTRMSVVDQVSTTARPFMPEQLSAYKDEPIKTEQTLQLLESLGLIVQVAPSTSSTRYYRRVTDLDRGPWPTWTESE